MAWLALCLSAPPSSAQVVGSPMLWGNPQGGYTVTYDGNGNTGGSVPTDSATYLTTQTVTVLGSGTLVKTSAAFLGWNTQADGNGSTFAAGAKLRMGAANVTLYARWSGSSTFPSTADSISGDANDNLLAGGFGADTLVGGAGDDTIYPDIETGEDYLTYLRNSDALVFWLDASDPNDNGTPPSGGSLLTTWHDRSALNYDIAAVNAATYVTSGIGGKPSLRFDGSNDYYELSYKSQLNATSQTTFVVAQTRGNDGQYRSPLTSRSIESGANGYNFYATPTNVWVTWTGGGGGGWNELFSAVPSSVAQLLEHSISSPNSEGFVAGASLGTDTAFALNTSRPLRVGAGATEATAVYPFNGDISHVMIFNTNLSSFKKQAIRHIMSARYGLSMASATDPGLAADTLTGGAGADRFVWNEQSFSDPANRDIVTDFNIAEGDTLDFNGISLSFTVRGTSGLLASGVPEVAWVNSGGNTIVKLDYDGDGTAELEVQLNGVTHTDLTSSSIHINGS
jgi:Ca2+-binding RTX toxin-like protein